jgi:glutathione-regulated potassium-efflux system protein KefB
MQYSLWQLALLLAAAALAAPLGKQLKVGSVPGYLAAGIVIGPHVLGIFNEPENILHIAEIGVVMLLFIIGLELRPQRLWSMRMAVFGLGGAQVAATAIVLGTILTLITDFRTALFCGLALSLSSTAFVLQMLKERGELDTRHGRIAFAVLLFQDIAAIPMIALVGLLSPSGTAEMTPGNAIVGLLSIIAIILAGRFLLTRLYRSIAATGLQEAMTASALLTVIVIVLLMNAVGLSAALGAFIAGLVLAESEYRHEMEANIAPFEGLLLGLFFVAVGMSLDLTLLARHPIAIVLAVLALVAVKTAVLWPLGRIQRLSFAGSRRLALALSQGGEFAFVLTAAAAAERAISLTTADLINVVVTLSMLTTPVLLMLDDRLKARRPPAVPHYDKAMPQGEGHVVIAGLGRFGQIVARILRARRIPFTALDKSAEQVDFVRRFGSEIYYGDASRLEILEAAQTGRARAFVLAIDDVESSLRTAELVRRHYPELPIFARARNRTHVHKLMDLGVTVIERETFRAALEIGRQTLRGMGLSEAEVRRTIATFAEMDTRRLVEDYQISSDPEKMRANAMRQAEELEQLFAQDEAALESKEAAE